jgi:hypothetical protein
MDIADLPKEPTTDVCLAQSTAILPHAMLRDAMRPHGRMAISKKDQITANQWHVSQKVSKAGRKSQAKSQDKDIRMV